jgi:hypothetical protein
MIGWGRLAMLCYLMAHDTKDTKKDGPSIDAILHAFTHSLDKRRESFIHRYSI